VFVADPYSVILSYLFPSTDDVLAKTGKQQKSKSTNSSSYGCWNSTL
jgi:hypothetical protein